MRLIDNKTGNELHEGDALDYRRGTHYISYLDLKKKRVFLMPDTKDPSPVPVRPREIGARIEA